jgi:hypothetical protein
MSEDEQYVMTRKEEEFGIEPCHYCGAMPLLRKTTFTGSKKAVVELVPTCEKTCGKNGYHAKVSYPELMDFAIRSVVKQWNKPFQAGNEWHYLPELPPKTDIYIVALYCVDDPTIQVVARQFTRHEKYAGWEFVSEIVKVYAWQFMPPPPPRIDSEVKE